MVVAITMRMKVTRPAPSPPPYLDARLELRDEIPLQRLHRRRRPTRTAANTTSLARCRGCSSALDCMPLRHRGCTRTGARSIRGDAPLPSPCPQPSPSLRATCLNCNSSSSVLVRLAAVSCTFGCALTRSKACRGCGGSIIRGATNSGSR